MGYFAYWKWNLQLISFSKCFIIQVIQGKGMAKSKNTTFNLPGELTPKWLFLVKVWALVYPSSRHTASASLNPNPSSHTNPHIPSTRTCRNKHWKKKMMNKLSIKLFQDINTLFTKIGVFYGLAFPLYTIRYLQGRHRGETVGWRGEMKKRLRTRERGWRKDWEQEKGDGR